ncbi:hypothetical protein [Burkholderia multivorans]|uniref:hypothetical protein n=1 Tax=Burkholderia multivorans TaxID=87883 RepID=UPI0020B28E66|nr:hypothetical protein [Burkholderia multivorans]
MGLRQFVNGAPAVVYVQRIRLAGVLVMAHGMTAERVDVNAVEQPVKLLRCQFDHLLMPSRPHETVLLEPTQQQPETSALVQQMRISVMVISRFGERDQFGRWCCAVNGL